MSNWKGILISPAASIRHGVQVIDAGGLQIALVVDAEGRLLGTVSDGDVRRAILRGISLDASVAEIMNKHPTVAGADEDRNAILATMQAKQLRRIPVVDAAGRVIGLDSLDDLVRHTPRENIVVLLAGGLGTRLRPLTVNVPKPMAPIGTVPMMEHVVRLLKRHGIANITALLYWPRTSSPGCATISTHSTAAPVAAAA